MQLLSLRVQNIRGISDLSLQLDGESIVLWGPNGSGKSSVVDAIDFLLTGRISRLAGEGTGEITLTRHGPHLDHDPESAVVTASVKLEGIDDPVELRRCIASPDELECPDNARTHLDDIGAVVRRSGVILTRRDILRYITATPGTRADEVQELLNLKELDDVRSSLYRARTELRNRKKAAENATDTARADVNVNLGGPRFTTESLLSVVNSCRSILGVEPLDVPSSSVLKADISVQRPHQTSDSSVDWTALRQSTLNIREQMSNGYGAFQTCDQNLRKRIAELKTREGLLAEIARISLIDRAIHFIDDATTECPLCGTTWAVGHLTQYLEEKKRELELARAEQEAIIELAKELAEPARNLRANVETIMGGSLDSNMDASTSTAFKEILLRWRRTIDSLLTALENPVEQYLNLTDSAVMQTLSPDGLAEIVDQIEQALQNESPELTPEQRAWDTLTRLEENTRALERRTQEEKVANHHRSLADTLFNAYEKGRDLALQSLYTRISKRFAELYCMVHDHEKDYFDAEFQSKGASLKFGVDFLGRGTHPPHALHSEGHQDSMGICLFLALNEELATPKVDLVVLDDVMMSVDSGHRKELCRLLKEQFPNRQFVITTHDKTWAKQLKQEQVVQTKRFIELTAWALATGPRVHQQLDVWEEIREDLEREKISEAAFKLRRNSEEYFEGVCDALGARLVYNSGTEWQLDDWLPSAMEQYKSLMKSAQRSASSWDDEDALVELRDLESVRKQIYGRTHVEQWAINSTVHFNNWENMSREDFSPVVEAFRDLYALFACSDCRGLLQLLPRKGSPEVVKCNCGKVNLNLRLAS